MIGETLLHYRLIAKLGEGGMATVYRAQDTRLGRTVALKVLTVSTSNDPKRRQRFLREARAAAALSHPNIVSIYEIGSERDIDFIAMELVEGKALSKLLRKGPLPIPETLSYAAQISSALAKAHSCGVVHRDLKPSNSTVTAEGFVKLLDFGLAQINPFVVSDGVQTPSSAETVSAITESGAVLGTYAYMSPEQARGEILDPRTDMFSFGIMLYEMLSGVRPFVAGNTVELLHKTMYSEPKPIRELRADTPAALADIVAKCLAKHRDARFPSMDPVAESLRAMDRALDSNSAGQATLPLKTPRNWKFLRRNRSRRGRCRRRSGHFAGGPGVPRDVAFFYRFAKSGGGAFSRRLCLSGAFRQAGKRRQGGRGVSKNAHAPTWHGGRGGGLCRLGISLCAEVRGQSGPAVAPPRARQRGPGGPAKRDTRRRARQPGKGSPRGQEQFRAGDGASPRPRPGAEKRQCGVEPGRRPHPPASPATKRKPFTKS